MPELLDLLERSAAGDGLLIFLPDGTEVSYTEIWRQSADVARAIRARAGTGGAVAAVLTNTPACAPNFIGVWRSGNDLVSLPHPGRGTSIPRYQAQIETMLALSGASLLLVEARFLPLIPQLSVPVLSFEEMLGGGPPTDVGGSGRLIQFTSGSVGSPKGVVLSQEAVATNILSLVEVIEPGPGDTPCTWLPLSHDMGLIGMFLTPLVSISPEIGASGVFPILSPEYFLARPTAWLEACSRYDVTITTAPNFAMELVSRARSLHGPLDLSSLRIAITGAERVSAATLTRFTSTFADAGLRAEALCPAYGMAEATLAITMVRPKEHWHAIHVDRDAVGEGRVQPAGPDGVEYVSNGAALPGVEVRVAAEDGAVGEVQLRTGSLLSGYVGADLRMTPDGWFPTRDLGFLQGDELFLVGRSDDTVIVGGRNYYAADIEAVVEHPAVRRGNLAAVPLDVGYALVVELRADVAPAEQETVCRELAVAANQAVGIRPSSVAVVPRGSLYKTPSGKLQRPLIARELRSGDLPSTASVTFGGL